MGVPENMASMDSKNARYINSSWISQQTELMHTATMHMTNVSSAIIDVFDRAMLPAFMVNPTLLRFGNNDPDSDSDDNSDSDNDSDDGNLRVSSNKRKHTNNTKTTQNKQPRQSSTHTSVNKNWCVIYLFIYLFIYLLYTNTRQNSYFSIEFVLPSTCTPEALDWMLQRKVIDKETFDTKARSFYGIQSSIQTQTRYTPIVSEISKSTLDLDIIDQAQQLDEPTAISDYQTISHQEPDIDIVLEEDVPLTIATKLI